ncbi:WD40 repeat domain-containing protein [Streptomyces sp. NPDC049040]|uniref:WD40 repeat domain-containing protein n=1 Tax=Streptomyces sp. NPDC049040 TaxID=3365593 RepID=UPI003717B487
MDNEEITLARPDEPRTKFWRISRDGARLVRASWAGDGKARESVREIGGSAADVRQAYQREVRKKMRDGFVFVRDVREARVGELVLECLEPNGHDSRAFDLRPDGALIAVGSVLKDAHGAEIHLIDVATGARRLVHTEPYGPAGSRQTFLHQVLFDAGGSGLVYAVNGQTRHLDLRTGTTRVLADYQDHVTSRFNPFCVKPLWDGRRERLLVFDANDMVRVLDAHGRPVWEVSTASPTTECRAAAISASGRRVALYRPSRGIVYGHQDAEHDTTNEIEVWDIDDAQRVGVVRVPAPLSRRGLSAIGFDGPETHVLTSPDPVQGPCALSADGLVAWHFPDERRTDRWDTCFSWAYSPDGSLLAIGRRGSRGLDLRDATSREPVPFPLERVEDHRVHRIAYSADGTLIAAGGDSGVITVRKLRGGLPADAA